jgi:hypothetical protein
MTVMRLPGRGLLVHSPIRATTELVDEVQALGPVAYIVAPNRFHHRFVGGWQQAFPDAATYVAPGLERKRPDLKIAGVLGIAPERGWADGIDQVFWGAFPRRMKSSSSTAPVPPSSQATWLSTWAPAVSRSPASPSGWAESSDVSRPRLSSGCSFATGRRSVTPWPAFWIGPFERVVVAHGEVCEQNGRNELVRGYSWILGAC